MFSLRNLSVILGLFLAVIVSSSAFARTSLTIGAVGTYSRLLTNQAALSEAYTTGFPGGAALVRFGGAGPLKLELGGWYQNRNTQESLALGGPVLTTYNQYWAQGTGNLIYALSRSLHLAAGGYYASQVSGDNFHGIGTSPKDYGIMYGLEITLPLSAGVGLEIDGTYQYGLNDMASGTLFAPNNVYGRTANLLVGLHFGGL